MKIIGARPEDCERALARLRPRIPLRQLRLIDEYTNALRYELKLGNVRLTAILEVEAVLSVPEGEWCELWAHLSLCARKPARIPLWEELRRAKEIFLGDWKAVCILPPAAEYVNEPTGKHVLHLYAPLERDPFPDFRGVDERGVLSI